MNPALEEYIDSLIDSLKDIDNKHNVTVDICFNIAQNLEKIDKSHTRYIKWSTY